MSRMKTTGDLRQFLADSIMAVKNGHMDSQKASDVTKMAAQITESFYSEVKVAKTMKELGRSVKGLGELPIGNYE